MTDYAELVRRIDRENPQCPSLMWDCRAAIEALVREREMSDLCRRAVESLRERDGEDIEAWARQLAEDVADAND
jgi:hypothetical protein